MKLLTWTLKRPVNGTFETYANLVEGEPWYSPNYEIINPNAMDSWDAGSRSFMEMLEKYTDKFYAIGMHEFEINTTGHVLAMQWSSRSGYRTDSKYHVLTDDLSAIREGNEVVKSLRYAMHKYPNIKWACQFLATTDRVIPILDNIDNAQDVFIQHCYRIVEIYKTHFPMVKTVEIDMEKTTTRTDVNGVHESVIFRDFLVRVKNEVCIPLGMELRVNLYAMTGDFNPQYYGWHDYATVASGVDKNGNQAIDEFQLMSYDFSWGGSAPGASTPLWWLENIMEHVARVLPPHKTFIGNAGYGRRWALGEWNYDDSGNPIEHSLRQGGTLDYKQLMQVQNGMFIHNVGKTINGQFRFFNQDFIPFCGFNDDESDYLKTFIHVYDRFSMASNGGGTFNGLDRPSGVEYITQYSTRQKGIFTGVADVIDDISSKQGIIDESTSNEFPKADGINMSNYTWKGYGITQVVESGTQPQATYTFNVGSAGTYKVIAMANFPFYTSSDFTININGNSTRIYIPYDWYPMMCVQRPHWYDCGTFNLPSSGTISFTYTGGGFIHGFVICKDFKSQMIGGNLQIKPSLYPMKRIANQDEKGNVEIVNAQFPSQMRIVGEILRRPPRPAIIWEDMFSSYIEGGETDENGNELTYEATSYLYYYPTSKMGYSVGNWKIHWNCLKSTSSGTSYNILALNKSFSSDIYLEMQYQCTDRLAKYGAVIISSDAKYYVIADHVSREFKIVKDVGGRTTTLTSVPMSNTFFNNRANSRVMKVTILGGKISLLISDNCYIKEFDAGITDGAVGICISNGTIKTTKYHIASLNRWERLERTIIEVDGVETEFGGIPRTCEVDEYGYLIYTGYPHDLKGTFNNVVSSTQVDPTYSWSEDYMNLPLATVDAWQGSKTVTLTMLDAGIWLKTLFIGDAEGMSIAYNSDQIGFRKTVDFVYNYGCKGIAMWTLGQEDPMIYKYLH